MLKRLKNSARNCRSNSSTAAVALAEGRVLDKREVKVVEGRPAEGVAAQRAEVAAVRSGAAGQIDGDREVGGVVGAQAEVVFATFARGGEMRHGDLVGAVDAVRARRRSAESRNRQ